MARALAVEPRQSMEELRARAHVERDPRVRCRLLAIAYVQSGHSAYEGDGLFGLSAVQIRQWIKRYNAEGIEVLSDRPRPGASPHLAPEREAEFLARLHAGPPPERELAAWRGEDIRQLTVGRSVQCRIRAVRRLRIAASAGAILARAASEPHQERSRRASGIQKISCAKRWPPSRQATRRTQSSFGLQDEARFGPQGSNSRVWADTGSRPQAPRQTEYEFVYLFGACCPGTGESNAWLMPMANTETMNGQLSDLGRQLPDQEHVALILYGAGWHHSTGLNVPHNITLIPFPPCLPELNPVELVSHELRQRHLSNRIYSDADTLQAAVTAAWLRLANDPQRLRSLTNYPWIQAAQDRITTQEIYGIRIS